MTDSTIINLLIAFGIFTIGELCLGAILYLWTYERKPKDTTE